MNTGHTEENSQKHREENSPKRCLVQDRQRVQDVEEKHRRIRELLASSGADAVLLQDPANISWFAAGADIARCASESCQTSVFATEDARLFATNAVDSAQLFEREAFGLGFQLKQREWFQPHSALVEDLCRGRRVISDSGVEGTRNVARRIHALRLPMTPLEIERLRKLCRVVVHAVEVTAGHLRKGMTEAAVAGEISHRLLRKTVTPVRIQVCADGRNSRYRHWTFSEDRIESFATVSCIARRWGLHAAVSRTVCLATMPDELWTSFQKAVLVHGTGLYFSRHGQPLNEIWPKVRRIYEKFGLANEWQLSDQADVIGYRTCEQQLTPSSDFVIQAPTALYWHPGVGSAMLGDTVLVMPTGCDIMTRSESWPELRVQVKGRDVPCPGILLIRDSSSSPEAVHPGAQDTSDFGLFSGFGLADEDPEEPRMDSIWELDMSTSRSVFDEVEPQYSEESVLD